MLAPVTHILPITSIRRERLLPAPGKVIVRKGQRVGATDVVAEANLFPEHLVLDIARGLGIRREQVDEHIQVQAGAQVAAGDVVAGPVGLTRRVVRSPRNGRVIIVGNGQILLEAQSQPFVLRAGIPGEVVELVPDRGAVIETTGALIQGVWGNGPADSGLMQVLVKEPEEDLTPDKIDVGYRSSIVLAGYCRDAEVLKTAGDLPLRGLILSSMDPALAPLAMQLSIPIVILEGFGRRPINTAAFKLLSTHERREVVVNAEPWDPYAGTRPEVVIPLPASGDLSEPPETAFFTPGKLVRIVRAPYAGRIGSLVELRGVTTFPSGLQARAAEIHLEDGHSVFVPQANLEILE